MYKHKKLGGMGMFSLDTTRAFFEAFIAKKYYLTLLDGIQQTLLITLIATIIGLLIGGAVAMIQVIEVPRGNRRSDKIWRVVVKVLKKIAKLYIDIIRGTPAVAQVSFIWLVVFSSPIWPASIAGGISFGINSGAYMAELIRAGIQGIDKGQFEAGRSLGLNYGQTMRHIIMPQALKQMLPALVNEFIVLIKETAVVGFIGGKDIMRAGNIMIGQTGNFFIPLLMVCTCYLIITGIFTKIMRIVERKISNDR